MSVKREMIEDVVCLLVAAIAQKFIPATASWPVKFYFLTAVALRMALVRPVAEGLVCALWAGILTDALSGLPLFCTASFLLLMYSLARFLRHVFLTPSFLHGMLLCGFAAMGQTAWIKIWMGAEQPLTFVQILARCGLEFPAGIVAGLAGFAGCALVDHFSGRENPAEEDHAVVWSETH